jgi:hypothetical protein
VGEAAADRRGRPVPNEEDSMSMRALAGGLLTALLLFPIAAAAQGRPDSAALLKSEREALHSLAWMDGVWRGPAWTILPGGEKHEVTQTERIGPMLDGSIKVLEGKSYDAAGKSGFNAFGVVSFDPGKSAYTLHSYAMGQAGDFVLTPSDSGYVWEIPAGPMTIRYTAFVRGGKWREIGERIAANQAPVQFFEMNLVRVRDTDWPAAKGVNPKD